MGLVVQALVALAGGMVALAVARSAARREKPMPAVVARPREYPAFMRPMIAEMLRRRCCPDCASELPRELVCPRCGVDHRGSARQLHPRCRSCKADLASCDACAADWCLGCTPGPVRCPGCGMRCYS